MLKEGEMTDQALHIGWHASDNLAPFIEVRRTGAAGLLVPPMANPHLLTPETANSTHYFFTHESGPEAEAMARKLFLDEDEPSKQQPRQPAISRAPLCFL